jgi:magnesium transporter
VQLTELNITIDHLRELFDEDELLDREALDSALDDLHPSDIASIINQLTLPQAMAVFQHLTVEQAAEVLAETSPETTRHLLESTAPERTAQILGQLETDDVAEVVSELGLEHSEAEHLLSDLSASDKDEVRELLSFPERTAGRLMTNKFAALGPDATAHEVLEYLRLHAETLETVNEAYVVDGNDYLLGVMPMRLLLLASANQPCREFMISEPLTVPPEADQQDVARIIARYNFQALPVTTPEGRILGIVTVDDTIDVLMEEFNEDYLKLVGSDAEEMDRRSPAQVARLRLPWLMGTMVIELFAGGVISRFDHVLKEVILLASFMPVISAISGNVGLQAAAIVVRGLDTGHVSLHNWWRALAKEMSSSLLMALVCGLVLGTVGAVWSQHVPFGLIIGGSMTASMFTASCLGTLIPMISKRMGFDPATSAGPFETAFQDVIGFAVFLWLASLLLPWLK